MNLTLSKIPEDTFSRDEAHILSGIDGKELNCSAQIPFGKVNTSSCDYGGDMECSYLCNYGYATNYRISTVTCNRISGEWQRTDPNVGYASVNQLCLRKLSEFSSIPHD